MAEEKKWYVCEYELQGIGEDIMESENISEAKRCMEESLADMLRSDARSYAGESAIVCRKATEKEIEREIALERRIGIR